MKVLNVNFAEKQMLDIIAWLDKLVALFITFNIGRLVQVWAF